MMYEINVYKCIMKTRVACAVKESEMEQKIEKQIPYLLVIRSFLGKFWLCFSHPSHAIFMSLRTQEKLQVKIDCADFNKNRIQGLESLKFSLKGREKKVRVHKEPEFFPKTKKAKTKLKKGLKLNKKRPSPTGCHWNL